MHFELAANTMRLAFDPVRGRRTFYAVLTIGRRRFWLMRWDTARCADYRHQFCRSKDGLMQWTCGIHKL